MIVNRCNLVTYAIILCLIVVQSNGSFGLQKTFFQNQINAFVLCGLDVGPVYAPFDQSTYSSAIKLIDKDRYNLPDKTTVNKLACQKYGEKTSDQYLAAIISEWGRTKIRVSLFKISEQSTKLIRIGKDIYYDEYIWPEDIAMDKNILAIKYINYTQQYSSFVDVYQLDTIPTLIRRINLTKPSCTVHVDYKKYVCIYCSQNDILTVFWGSLYEHNQSVSINRMKNCMTSNSYPNFDYLKAQDADTSGQGYYTDVQIHLMFKRYDSDYNNTCNYVINLQRFPNQPANLQIQVNPIKQKYGILCEDRHFYAGQYSRTFYQDPDSRSPDIQVDYDIKWVICARRKSKIAWMPDNAEMYIVGFTSKNSTTKTYIDIFDETYVGMTWLIVLISLLLCCILSCIVLACIKKR